MQYVMIEQNKLFVDLIDSIKLIVNEGIRWNFLDSAYYKYPGYKKKISDCDIVFICNRLSLKNCETLINELAKIILKIDKDNSIFIFPTFRLQNLNLLECKTNLLHLTIYHSVHSAICYENSFMLSAFEKKFHCFYNNSPNLSYKNHYSEQERILYYLCQIWIETTIIKKFGLLTKEFVEIECMHKYDYIIKILKSTKIYDSKNLIDLSSKKLSLQKLCLLSRTILDKAINNTD
jgi:hypothetical protein